MKKKHFSSEVLIYHDEKNLNINLIFNSRVQYLKMLFYDVYFFIIQRKRTRKIPILWKTSPNGRKYCSVLYFWESMRSGNNSL